jgi:hypothetical protein
MRKYHDLFALGLLTIFGLSGFPAHGAETGSIPVGTVLPAFTMQAPPDKADQDYLGLKASGPFTLSDMSGKLFIIEFMSVMCQACHKAVPTMNRLYDAIKEDPALSKEVKMLAASAGNDIKQIRVYKKQFRVSFPVVPDRLLELYKGLNVPGTPYTIAVNKEGKVLWSHGGALDDFDQTLKEIREIHKQL